jgi:ABC-type amino acid transport substrate-binding protein
MRWEFPAVTLAYLLLSSGGHSQTLIAAYQEGAPRYIRQGASIVGICPDLYDEINQRLANQGIQIRKAYDFMPQKRIIQSIELDQLDVTCGVARTPEREAKAQFGSESIAKVQLLLVARADETAIVHSLDDVAKVGGLIESVAGSTIQKRLEDHGRLQIESGTLTLERALIKLTNKRLQFVLYHNYGISYELQKYQYRNKFKIIETDIPSYNHYLMFRPGLPANVISAIDGAIAACKADGTLRRIYERYGLGALY